MSKMTWEVYEDNGGGLYMVILKDGTPFVFLRIGNTAPREYW